MGNKKGEYIAILILLGLCIAGTMFGIAGKVLNPSTNEPSTNNNGNQGNVNKDLLFENKLHFYSYGELLGTYQCSEGYLYCGFAYEYIDDQNYSLDYYNDGVVDMLPIVADKYVFISDNKSGDEYYRQDGVILYDITKSHILVTYQAVKDYTAGIEKDLFIVKLNNKWGIIRLDANSASTVLDPTYDYIGVQNVKQTGSDKLVSDEFAALNGSIWSIIDSTGARLSTSFSNQIVSYNGQNVVLVNGAGKQMLYTYQGQQLLNNMVYNKIVFVGRYVGVYDNSNYFYIVNPTDNSVISNRHAYTNIKDLELEFKDNTVLIKIAGQVVETVNI